MQVRLGAEHVAGDLRPAGLKLDRIDVLPGDRQGVGDLGDGRRLAGARVEESNLVRLGGVEAQVGEARGHALGMGRVVPQPRLGFQSQEESSVGKGDGRSRV